MVSLNQKGGDNMSEMEKMELLKLWNNATQETKILAVRALKLGVLFDEPLAEQLRKDLEIPPLP